MPEPSYDLNNIILIGLPFTAYFLGIVIRKVAMPGKTSAPLIHQLLLGIPVSLVVVSPFIPVLTAVNGNLVGFLVTSGVIMEHGMLVNETAVSHLRTLNEKRRRPDDPDHPSGSAPVISPNMAAAI